MKKIISIILCSVIMILLFTSCFSNKPSQTSSVIEEVSSIDPNVMPQFDKGSLRLNGSTACIPLAAALLAASNGISVEEATESINFSGTSNAIYDLCNGFSNLVLTYESTDIDSGKAPTEKYAISRDALVFIVNSANKVEGITTEQARDIYAGKITNWSKLGGTKTTIAAFQRPTNSGSGVMMEKLVMKGTALAKPPEKYKETYIAEGMDGIVKMVIDGSAEYGNEKNGIGYSVYYYIHNMYSVPEIKVLAIDGVAPSNATIASGEYPLTNEIYAVIRADEPQDSPIRQLVSWLQGAEGKSLIEKAGYVKLDK
ncbi:MAG: substrate-binding domain-containing protein [Oscillospiraceae bacterium]|jgi:phosphate transport system substrate-binding protein|nr:substrate-binding domain-containing protein [Oscillospiraceae bacterium]